MAVPSLKIASIEIALETWPMRQEFSPLEGSAVTRMLDGTALKQTHWRKLATRIEGEGWAPAALAAVDWSEPVEIASIAPRAIHSATVNATLPAARRSDFTGAVTAWALVAGRMVSTPVSIVTNAATATAVAGATGYIFHYYPKFNAYSSGPTETLDAEGAAYGWELEAEEV